MIFSPTMTSYRYPGERLILTLTLTSVLIVIAVSAAATFCASAAFILLFVLVAAWMNQRHHQSLVRGAQRISPQTSPQLAALARQCSDRLRPGAVEFFVVPSAQRNAYTFGLSSPQVVVLYSSLFKIMDEDELRFILGHELGHVALGHTRLNSLVGGMAGIPSTSGASALLALAFLWWNRACEYSADRAGLIACGKPDKAISALVKLVAGPAALSHAGMEQAYRLIDAEDDTIAGLMGEALGSHPMIIRRIHQIRAFAASAEYRRWNAS